MFYKTVTLVLCSICTITLFSQKNFVPAYLTTRDGKSFIGEIDYREWTVNPESIRFRSSETGQVQELGIDALQSFQIDYNQEKYVRAEVDIIMESIEFGHLPVFRNIFSINPEPRVRYTVFLRVMAEGALNLYQFIDPAKQVLKHIGEFRLPSI